MKLRGQEVKGIYIETVVIPRPSILVNGKEEQQYHVFKLQAVLDFDDFDKICPRPEPPLVRKPGGATSQNVEDKKYKEDVEKWALQRFNWAFLKSISATPELEWETVDLSKPETWANYETELKKAGFSVNEIGRLYSGFHASNAMDESKVEAARKSFLAGQQAL